MINNVKIKYFSLTQGYYDLEYFWPLKTLRILNLSHNQIEYVNEDLFLHLPFLEYLDLSYNPIGSIDDTTRVALSGIPFLKVGKIKL